MDLDPVFSRVRSGSGFPQGLNLDPVFFQLSNLDPFFSYIGSGSGFSRGSDLDQVYSSFESGPYIFKESDPDPVFLRTGKF